MNWQYTLHQKYQEVDVHLHLISTWIMEELWLPSELVGIHSYCPISSIETPWRVRVLDVSTGIVTPFFFQTYVISSGIPLAVISRVILEPASAVTSPDELVMYAEANLEIK